MWVRRCPICDTVLRKTDITETITCSKCGWVWKRESGERINIDPSTGQPR